MKVITASLSVRKEASAMASSSVRAGFKITTRKKTHEVTELPSLKFVTESHPKHIIIVRIIKIVVFIPYPLHFGEVLRLDELLVVFGDVCIKLRLYRQVAEVINGFAQDIPAISFVGGNLRHGKISLTQHNTL